MNFVSAVRYTVQGYRIRRTNWQRNNSSWLEKLMRFFRSSSPDYIDDSRILGSDDILAEDWEIIVDGIVSEFPIIYKD
jgi:hypothetical protein